MLRWLLGEVVIGLLIAGLALAVAVPAAARFGYDTGPLYGLMLTLCVLATSVFVRQWLRRRKLRQSS